jgi:hypothetical protein
LHTARVNLVIGLLSYGEKERIYRKEYGTMEEIKSDMFEYIELFYNRKRMHSHLGYRSPAEFRIAKEKEKLTNANTFKMHIITRIS